MRRGVIWVSLLFVFAAQAGQLPMTAKDVGLMLRAGYSSNALMQELSARYFADTLDEAKEKALVQAGASAELINTLKSGTYSLSVEKMAAAQQQMADQAKRRAAEAEAAHKIDIARQTPTAANRNRASMGPNAASDAIYKFLKGDLVQFHNGGVVHAEEETLANKKLIAFYFSAHWCAPCRKFTPQLVEYYNRVAPQHPEFEIVFVSLDKSQFAMETYMHETNMPWPALDYVKQQEKEVLAKNAGDGIPSLVLVDSNGNVISSSHSGSQNFGPQKVLSDLDAIFAGKPAPQVAAAH
jgi:nucleoredoxin